MDDRARLELLAEAGRVLSESLDSETTLDSLARLTIPQFADYCLLFESVGEDVSPVASAHVDTGKEAILHEIREQVALPLLDEADTALLNDDDRPALGRIERFLVSVLESLERDERQRRALTVMLFKCEYVDGLAAELAGSVRNSLRLTKAFEAAYASARRQNQLAAGVEPAMAAIETAMFFSGLLRLWLLHPPRSHFRRAARAAIAQHMRGRASL